MAASSFIIAAVASVSVEFAGWVDDAVVLEDVPVGGAVFTPGPAAFAVPVAEGCAGWSVPDSAMRAGACTWDCA
jgi:hypothetical protein